MPQSATPKSDDVKVDPKPKAAATKSRAKAPRKSSAAQSPLETYLREINETALLTAEEELQLARQIEQGDVMARDRMVRANLRLVVNLSLIHI